MINHLICFSKLGANSSSSLGDVVPNSRKSTPPSSGKSLNRHIWQNIWPNTPLTTDIKLEVQHRILFPPIVNLTLLLCRLHVLMVLTALLHVSFALCVLATFCHCDTVDVICTVPRYLFTSMWWCSCLSVCVAIDIDATDLEPEDNELPVNLRSPKASPNTVMSPLAKEKRMPFFKKVNSELPRPHFFSVRPLVSEPNACRCSASLSTLVLFVYTTVLVPWRPPSH